MRILHIYILSFVCFVIGLFSPTSVFAQNIKTAIGNINATPSGLANYILTNSIKLAGGIAFLLLVYGSFLFMTSAGEPNKLQEATDVIFSALAGLLFIIFSYFLLDLIGVKLLGI